MSPLATHIVRLLPHRTASVLLLIVLSLCTGFSGLAMNRINESESSPAESELVVVEIMATERCRRRSDRLAQHRQAQYRLSGIIAALHAAHPTEPSLCLAAMPQSEHAFRNGGIGAPLRC